MATANKIFDNLREQWKATLNVGRLVTESNISVSTHPAKFLHFQSDKAMLRAKAVVAGNRFYLIVVGTQIHNNAMKAKNGYEEIALAFLDKFSLTNQTQQSLTK